MRIDDSAVVWISVRRHPILDHVMRFVTRLGDGPLWIAVAAALLPVGTKGRHVALQFGISLGLNLLVYKFLKKFINRPRPFDRLFVVQRGVEIPDEFSFPSGHSAAAFVAVVVVGSSFSSLVVPLLLLALLIGSSRVYLGMHYPSDIVAGFLLGYSAGRCGMFILG
jgi:undecaprenyl-diphosphatase